MHDQSYGKILQGLFLDAETEFWSVVTCHAHLKLLFFSEALATDREKCASTQPKMGQGGGGGRDRERNPDLSGEKFM